MAPLVQHLTHVSTTSMIFQRLRHVARCPDCRHHYFGRRELLLPY